MPGFVGYPSISDLAGRYKACGWSASKSCNMLTVYKSIIPQSERTMIEKIELFDEIEEWQLLMSHYAMSIAVNCRNKDPSTYLKRFMDIIP